jgi:alcohol dehydrogenase class IV
VYDNVTPNPTLPEVDAGVIACNDAGADFVVGVGGGSAIDAAKGIAVTSEMGGAAKTYLFGAGTVPFPNKMKPLFAVPTTCGTGSEISAALDSQLGKRGLAWGRFPVVGVDAE